MVTIEQDVGTSTDDHGQPIEDWQIYCERHAEAMQLEGQELFTSQQRWPEVDTELILRADSETAAIAPKMRARYQDRFGNQITLNILSSPLDEEGRGIWYTLKCRKEGN